jgi:uncharacterized protein YceK
MKYAICLAVLAGCASVQSEHDSPERKAHYAQCEEQSNDLGTYLIGGGIARAMKISDCMKAKGY